jgi:hypothetical protein
MNSSKRNYDRFPVKDGGNDEEDNPGYFTWAQILRRRLRMTLNGGNYRIIKDLA